MSGLLDETLERFSSAFDALVAADAAIVPGDDDPVLRRIDALLNAGAAKDPDPLLVRQRVEDFATWRAPNQIPPGWRDVADKYTPLLQAGDYLLWSELLDHAARTPTPFLLVTNDQKDDWFAKDGEPLRALVNEFGRRSAHRYGQMNFNDFLALARTALGAAVAETTLEEIVEERRTSADAAGPDDSLHLLRAAMEQLSERDRQVLTLHFFEEMDPAEIASAMGVTRPTLARMRAAALSRLRDTWNEFAVT